MYYSYDYETLDGERRYSHNQQPSRIFVALQTLLFLLSFSAISRSFGHHARKDAGLDSPPAVGKTFASFHSFHYLFLSSVYNEIAASFSQECPPSTRNSSLSSVTWNLNWTSNEKPDFPYYAMQHHDLTILGPKSTLVDELTKAMAAIYGNEHEVRRERRHAGTVYLSLLNKLVRKVVFVGFTFISLKLID